MPLRREAYAAARRGRRGEGRINFVGNIEAKDALLGRGRRHRGRRLFRQYHAQDHGGCRKLHAGSELKAIFLKNLSHQN